MLLEAKGPAHITGFHAQQAVEKLLKALLVAHGMDPQDTHVIGQLVGQLHRLDRTTADSLGAVDQLTPYAVLLRYPPRAGRVGRMPSRERVMEHVEVARRACAVLDDAIASKLEPPAS